MRLVIVVSLCVLGALVGCTTEPEPPSVDPLPVPDVPVAAVAPSAGEHDAAAARWAAPAGTATPRASGPTDGAPLDVGWWSVSGSDPSVIAVVLRQPTRPCSDQPTYRHEPRVTETPSAVVVGLARIEVDLDVPAGVPCDHSLSWNGDLHLVRLAAPLGGRVVVDATGAQVPVQSSR